MSILALRWAAARILAKEVFAATAIRRTSGLPRSTSPLRRSFRNLWISSSSSRKWTMFRRETIVPLLRIRFIILAKKFFIGIANQSRMSDIDFGNAASSVAICTFWTDRKRLLTKIPKDSYSIIGNLYSSHGINFLLQTLLANTQIRTIALFGHCMTQSDEDLLNLWKNGVVQGKISGTKVAVLLSSDDVELVRKHVQLLDLRGKSLDELNAAVASLPAEPPYAEPRNVLFAEEARVETLPSPLSGHYLYEDSVFAAWIKILNYVMKFGERKMTEYSEEQKEYNNVMVTIGSSVDVVEMGFR